LCDNFYHCSIREEPNDEIARRNSIFSRIEVTDFVAIAAIVIAVFFAIGF